MVQEKKVGKEFISDLVGKTSFTERLLTKDYYLTKILFLLKDVKGMYFKGGTALQKTILNHARISEDLDFTLTRDVGEIENDIKVLLRHQDFVKKVDHDKSVHKFVRMVVYYDNFSGQEDTIFIDLNERGKLSTPSELLKMNHFYPDIPEFPVFCLSTEEMVAEKVAAAICRNRPRDHYDIYQIIKHKIPINMQLVEKKCKESGQELSIIRMFNNAKKLKNRWDEDMIPLLKDEVTFNVVMQTLSAYFKLKEEKEKQKSA